MTIRKERGGYVLRSKTGKKLGTHATRAGAQSQERAIKANKRNGRDG